MNYTNEELEELTLKWGQDRKITINGKIGTQFIKLVEEYGEFFDSDGNIELIKDSIGDQIVVLTMMNGILGVKFSTLAIPNKLHSFDVEIMVGAISSTLGQIANCISKNKLELLSELINQYFKLLAVLCVNFDITINECWNHAYNEIKDRTGYLNEDGCFIKDESISLVDNLDYFKTNKLS